MGVLIEVLLVQVDIRPPKPSDAVELQRAVLNSVGHIGPWLDWCTPRYVLSDARDWVAESMVLWQQCRAFRWVMLAEDKQQILGSVEVQVPTLEAPVGRMGYWVRHSATGQGYAVRELPKPWTGRLSLWVCSGSNCLFSRPTKRAFASHLSLGQNFSTSKTMKLFIEVKADFPTATW